MILVAHKSVVIPYFSTFLIFFFSIRFVTAFLKFAEADFLREVWILNASFIHASEIVSLHELCKSTDL